MTIFAWLFALVAALSSATSPAAHVAPAPAASLLRVAAHATVPGEAHTPAPTRVTLPAPLCPDGTSKVPTAGGHLGCPGPDATPGPVGVPPGFTAVDPAPANPADPCFRQDPECYATVAPTH